MALLADWHDAGWLRQSPPCGFLIRAIICLPPLPRRRFMDTETSPIPPQALPEGRFTGRTEFTDMIRQAFAAAAQQGWREIIVCDPDFEDWPLGERVVVQALNDWSKTGRKFTMLAGNYDEVLRKHARFVTWRRTWAHIVECRANASAAPMKHPAPCWAPAGFLSAWTCSVARVSPGPSRPGASR
jgi:hypothetical protein